MVPEVGARVQRARLRQGPGPAARRGRRRSRRRTPRRPGSAACAASAGRRTSSPGRHGRPSGRQTSRKPAGPRLRRRGSRSVASTARMSPSHAGNPASACSMAAARTASRDEAPPARVGVGPGADGARDGDRRTGPRSGIRSSPAAAERRDVSPAAGARPDPLSATCSPARLVPHQPERVAADPAAVRHDDAQHGVRGDRRVHRVAARGQHRQPGRRGEVVGRDDRAARARGRAGPGQARGVGRSCLRPRTARLARDRRSARSAAAGASGRSATASSTSERRRSRRGPPSRQRSRRGWLPMIWPRPRNTEYRPMIAPRSSG